MLYPGMKKGEKQTIQASLQLLNSNESNKFDFKKEKKNKEKPLSLEEKILSEMMTPSLKSTLIPCEYYLEVKPVYGSFEKMKKTPVIKYPLCIMPRSLEKLDTIIPEVENWSPQVYDRMTMDMSEINYSYCSHAGLLEKKGLGYEEEQKAQ